MDELYHYGVGPDDNPPGRGSGRYPKGSGENPYQHDSEFLKTYRKLKEENPNMSDTDIARAMGYTTTDFRAKRTIEKTEEIEAQRRHALRMYDHGYSKSEIARQLGVSEGKVRDILKKDLDTRNNRLYNTADMLRRQVDEKGVIDIGVGVEKELGISDVQLKTAAAMLKDEGYNIYTYYNKLEQNTNPGKYTSLKVLAKSDVKWKDILDDFTVIKSINDYTTDKGDTFIKMEYPKSLDSSRIDIRFGDEGGKLKDGVIEIRPGVADLNLGDSNYAQVRILVDGTHYMKGMAMYSKDIPEGKDIIYNTNKPTGTPIMSDDRKATQVLKPIEDKPLDPNNPFGATIQRQNRYLDSNGKETTGYVNIVNEEGTWGGWSKTLASQMLSKQSTSLISKQLNLSFAEKKDEFDEIMSLNNPSVKKKLLKSFADDCDASSVHLKAAALPRQSSHVILPIDSLKDTEIYAPNYKHGEEVVLIRYPHAGLFEIPRLRVNNNQQDARDILGNAKDAVGINSKVAAKLSGADFDGDTVLVIPVNGKVNIRSKPSLPGLKDFDPVERYPGYEGMKVISPSTKQNEMGKVSNLITDMTLKGASDDEITRAVRHSMVVIDAEKHKLNYKQSYIDNRIDELKAKYQNGGGASTLISLAKNEKRIPEIKQLNDRDIDPKTGIYIPKETGRTFINKKGQAQRYSTVTTQMEYVKDAHQLSSGTPQEELYADYANKLKSLANTARKEYLAVKTTEYSPSARKEYSNEVDSLKSKLNNALKNAPRERQAQIIATSMVKAKNADGSLHGKALSKERAKALASARARVGAGKSLIEITDKEWNAIQAGAIHSNMLKQILDNTDMDKLKERAMPRDTHTISDGRIARIRAMSATYTTSEIAEILGVSASTVRKYM